jgi:hypothetical protein
MARFKTKEELDLLTEEQIIKTVRTPILRNSKDWDENDSKDQRYIEELEAYCDIRFEATSTKIAEGVIELLKMGSTEIPEVLGSGNTEKFRLGLLKFRLKELGEPHYIKGLVLPE